MEHVIWLMKWLARHWAGIAAVLSIVIEVTPIKINPWSMIFKWIGKMIGQAINAPVLTELKTMRGDLDSVRSELEDTKREQQENEKDRIRWEILDFANSCRNGRRHTKDEYEHVFRMNDKYENMLKPGEKNSYFEAEYEYIKHLYSERQEKNDFL